MGISYIRRNWRMAEDLHISAIEINTKESILYIGVESTAFLENFVPLLAVKLNEQSDIVFKTPFSNNSEVVSHVIALRYNARLDLLYVSYLRSDSMTTVVDPLTGDYVGDLDYAAPKIFLISPDGNTLANVSPGGSWLRNGEIVEYQGLGFSVNMSTGEGSTTYLESNQGLYPPWEILEDHLVYVRQQPRQGIYQLEVYDRESGVMIASYDGFSEEVKSMPNQIILQLFQGQIS